MGSAIHPSVATGSIRLPASKRTDMRRDAQGLAHSILTRGTILIAIACTTASMWTRVDLARSAPWQCDEIPLLMRFTSLGLWASNETEARTKFQPGGYSLREGTIRSVSVPRGVSAYHTTTGFWSNLTLAALGYSPLVGRLMPLVWSLVAILAAATCAVLISRSALAGALAAIIVALSPFATAHAAQVRGYAEAMAAAPLLLLALEWWRRDPKSAIRICAVFLVALQASLTVYTVWVYWVFPVFAYAVVALPRAISTAEDRRAARAMLILTFLSLTAIMSTFTLQRLSSLSFTSTYGERFASPAAAISFVVQTAHGLLPFAPVTIVAAIIGLVALRRSDAGWCLHAGLASAAMLLLFAIVNGSAGYARNLSYLVGPVAALGGVGLAAALAAGVSHATRRTAPLAAGALIVIFGGASIAYASTLSERAYAQLLPDWGAVADFVAASNRPDRPRHLALCKANHWQIRWQLGTAANPPISEPARPFELIVGAQRDEDGDRVIFRTLSGRPGIRPVPLPEWFRNVPATSEIAGVELRTLTAIPIDLTAAPSDRPLLLAVCNTSSTSAEAWHRFIESGAAAHSGLIPMKEVWQGDAFVQTIIVGMNGPEAIDALEGALNVSRRHITAFTLVPPTE